MELPNSLPNSQSTAAPAEGPSPAALSSSVKDSYDSVKMKYFMSLGMKKPPSSAAPSAPLTSNATAHPPLVTDPTTLSKKERTKTTPTPNLSSMMFDLDLDEDDTDSVASRKKRSVSTPIPISPAVAPALGVQIVKSTRGDADSEGEDDDRTGQSGEIDFYSKIQKQLQQGKKKTAKNKLASQGVAESGDFEVGTARDQWIAEQQLRRNMPIV